MDLQADVRPGDRFNFYINEDNWMITKPTSNHIVGTIIGVDSDNVVVGWKRSEVSPRNSYLRGIRNLSMNYVSNESEYVECICISRDWLVHSQIIGSTNSIKQAANSDGMACKRCLEHYPYAVSNQKDGTLLCYSCRH